MARSRIRTELAGLTTRGRSFISAGLASALCALVLGQQDLLRVAVLLVALPLCCLAFLARTRYRIGLTRAVSPTRAIAGSPIRVKLELQNLARGGATILLAEDHTPPALGPPTRFVLARLSSGRKVTVTYSLQAAVRGRYEIGPMQLRVSDPFGMCETSRSFTSVNQVTVLPQYWALGASLGGGTWGGSGDSTTRAAAVQGEDDVATREYRDGDELRRIHWRSTAKRNQLMVRREEQPRQLRATVLLDSRGSGHAGEGWSSSYEWAVRMATSATVHLSDLHYGVRLVVDGTANQWTKPQATGEVTELLERFAVTSLLPDPARGPDSLDQALDVLQRSGGDGLVVALLGRLADRHVEQLNRLTRRGVPCLAVLLRVDEWAEPDPLPHIGARVPGTGSVDPATALRDAGWLVAEAGPDSIGSQVWAEATQARVEWARTDWGGRSTTTGVLP
jgi:uncharacterized protein (DUF58 family)